MSDSFKMTKEEREKTIEELKWYFDQLEMPYEDFDKLSDEALRDKLYTWDEYDPCPDI